MIGLAQTCKLTETLQKPPNGQPIHYAAACCTTGPLRLHICHANLHRYLSRTTLSSTLRPVPPFPVGRARQQLVVLPGNRPTCAQDERCRLRRSMVRALEGRLARHRAKSHALRSNPPRPEGARYSWTTGVLVPQLVRTDALVRSQHWLCRTRRTAIARPLGR
jgi:hypothetical protein